jgi:hypothetical protein
MHHLLKSPFSVHPSSRKVSVPIDLERLFDFDPEASVDLTTLIKELEGREGLRQNDPKLAKTTSLREAIEII